MASIKRMSVTALAVALAGCATLSDSREQVVTVQAIQDYRPLAGVGCILSNKAGRWFVMSPGTVAIQKSDGELRVDCSRTGQGAGNAVVASRLDTTSLIGNAVISAGLGYFVDRHSGAGFAYPSTLTVIMRAPERESETALAERTVVY